MSSHSGLNNPKKKLMHTDWLISCGGMSDLIRTMDWSTTSLGSRDSWPQNLRTVVNLILSSSFPMAILWGSDLSFIYNDAYQVIAAGKHPEAMGRSSREVWPEVWDFNKPIFERVMQLGETIYFHDQMFRVERKNYIEDAYFTLSYSPIFCETGQIGGTLVVMLETTERIRLEQQLKKSLETLELQVAEQRRTKELLRESENVFRTIFENNSSAMAIIEMDTTISLVNKEYCNLGHFEKEEVIGSSWTKQIPPEDLERLTEYNRKRLIDPESAPNNYEFKFYRKDGEIRHALMSLAMVQSTQQIICSFLDITDRMQVEAALLESEKRFRAIANYTPGWESWVDPDGKLLWVNPSVYELTGYSIEECMGMNDYPAPIAHQDDRERMMKVFNSSVQCSIGKNVEFRILCKDGIVKWAEVAYQPIYDENGENLGHRASIRDITARRQAEQQLYIHQIELTSQNEELHRAQEELEAARMRYFDLYDLAPVGYFTVSEPGLIQETNLTATKMLGVVRADLIKQPLTRFILKEDQDVFYRVHKHLFDTWVPQVCEMRMIRTDGTAFWAHTETTAALDDDGTPLCRVAVINISASKQAEEELRRHRESLERVVEVRTADLKKKGVDLEETNIALKVILQKREEGEKILETTFLDNIQKLIVPYMEELRRLNLTEPQKNCVNLIECQITAPFLQNLTARFAGFTSREIQVAHMIREGKSTKEIASTFNCSTRSVEFHRDNIRKKLQLSDRKANLHAYLLGLPEK